MLKEVIVKDGKVFQPKFFHKKKIGESNKLILTSNEKEVLRDMRSFYGLYCKEIGESPLLYLFNLPNFFNMEIYDKAVLYVQNHKILWRGEDLSFRKRFVEIEDELNRQINKNLRLDKRT